MTNKPSFFTIDGASVKNCGAIGDGKTDDTNAIQKAVDFTGNNGFVTFSRGDYYVARTIILGDKRLTFRRSK